MRAARRDGAEIHMHEREEGAADAGRAKLRALLQRMRVVMLTTIDHGGMLQARPMALLPMAAPGLQSALALYFFTRASSHKIFEVRDADAVNLAYASPETETYVSLSGRAMLVRDRTALGELWSDDYAAWFPDGLADPDLALLRVEVEAAETWDAASSSMLQLFGAAAERPSEAGERATYKRAAE